MTKSVEYKSLGFLIDELITTQFKQGVVGENVEIRERIYLLETTIARRIFKLDLSDAQYQEMQEYVEMLRRVLRECWDAQEVVRFHAIHSMEEVALAGIAAQQTNGVRNTLIREIDRVSNDTYASPTVKTYA